MLQIQQSGDVWSVFGSRCDRFICIFLAFELDDGVRGELQKVRTQFDESINKLDLTIMEYRKYGKEEIKQYNFYPDGMMQLAFQVNESSSLGNIDILIIVCVIQPYYFGDHSTWTSTTKFINFKTPNQFILRNEEKDCC